MFQIDILDYTPSKGINWRSNSLDSKVPLRGVNCQIKTQFICTNMSNKWIGRISLLWWDGRLPNHTRYSNCEVKYSLVAKGVEEKGIKIQFQFLTCKPLCSRAIVYLRDGISGKDGWIKISTTLDLFARMSSLPMPHDQDPRVTKPQHIL